MAGERGTFIWKKFSPIQGFFCNTRSSSKSLTICSSILVLVNRMRFCTGLGQTSRGFCMRLGWASHALGVGPGWASCAVGRRSVTRHLSAVSRGPSEIRPSLCLGRSSVESLLRTCCWVGRSIPNTILSLNGISNCEELAHHHLGPLLHVSLHSYMSYAWFYLDHAHDTTQAHSKRHSRKIHNALDCYYRCGSLLGGSHNKFHSTSFHRVLLHRLWSRHRCCDPSWGSVITYRVHRYI